MEPDFSGYATKAGVRCADGRVIMPGAFKHQDKMQVPLVWQHGHSDPTNVLGHAVLENRNDGVYVHAFFNDTEKAKHAKESVVHRDINRLSIWANGLQQSANQVVHGTIREVSLVLSGANPGAIIENITVRHSDDPLYDDILDDEAIIYSGDELDFDDITHADDSDEDDEDDDGETILDVYESMSDKQKDVLHYMVAEALAAGESDEDDSSDGDDEEVSHSDLDEKEEDMGTHHNVFESDSDGKKDEYVLSHSDMEEIFTAAQRGNSLKAAVEDFALAHGIQNIEVLFPEATNLTNTPEFLSRRNEWVNAVLGGAKKTPFSRVRTMWANLTFEEARAKGYVKGNLKKEEFFPVAKRTTTPTTIYKKQKLERDDILDIRDFDVVSWMRGEMRVMLDEELARAILVGDGRDPSSDDKINDQCIRPIATDHDLYTTKLFVNLDDANSSVQEIIDVVVGNRAQYRGTGLPTFFTTETIIAKFMLLKDAVGHRLYKNIAELAAEMRVADIVPVEVLEEYEDIVGIIVNMADYNIGADKGGEVSMFDDFDIDYNQYKYLLETRCSGALTKLKSAMVIRRTAGGNVLAKPAKPTFDSETGEITIPTSSTTNYFNVTDEDNETSMTNGASPYTVSAGTGILVAARPKSGYFFEVNSQTEWLFTMPSA